LVPGTDSKIRFGVIPQHEVMEAWCEESEGFYGFPHCPECGELLPDDVCDGDKCKCGYEIKWVGEDCYGDEPLSYYVDSEGYMADSDGYGDIFITKSPYYTRCGFCSPCAPGAGYITDRSDDCYAFCFGPEWFEDEPPYPIYRVSDGSRVE